MSTTLFVALWCGIQLLIVLLLVKIIKNRPRLGKFGSVSGALMEGRVVHVYGEFPGIPKSPVQQFFRVVAVQTETQPVVGLELHARGPAFMSMMPVRLTPHDAQVVAEWLEHAAAGAQGAPPGGGWWAYEATGLGTKVRGHFGTIEVKVGPRDYKLHVLRVGHVTHPVGIGIRGTVSWLSTKVVGALLARDVARSLAACLRHAASEASRAPMHGHASAPQIEC